MTKAELAEKVYEKVGFFRANAMEIVETVLEIIRESRSEGGR